MAKLRFKPPSEETLKLLEDESITSPQASTSFKAPSEETLKSLGIEEPKSALESLGETASDFSRGAASGITFGGIEELTAGGKAALESLTSTKDESLEDLYRRYLEIEEKKTKEARERSPVASMVGEFAGGLAPAFFTGGASMAATGGSTVGRLVGKELFKAAGRRAATEGAIGAAGGALAGGLSSEGKLIGATEEEKSKLLEDITSGALTGGVAGGSIGGILTGLGKIGGAVSKATKDYAGKTVAGKQIEEAFETGAKGIGYTTIPDKKILSQQLESNVENITGLMDTVLDKAGESIRNVLNVADDFGARVEFPRDQLENAISILESKNKTALVKKIKDKLGTRIDPITLTKEEVRSPSSINEIRNLLKETYTDPELYAELTPVIDSLKDAIENAFEKNPQLKENLKKLGLPNSYKKAMDNYSTIASSIPETIIGKGASTEYRGKFINEYGDPKIKLKDSVRGLVNKLFSPGSDIKDSLNTISALESNLNKIGSDPELLDVFNKVIKESGSSPEFIEKFGKIKDINDFKNVLMSKIEKAGLEQSTFDSILGKSPSEASFGKKLATGTTSLGREGTLRISNIAGGVSAFGKRAAKRASETAPVKISSALYSLPETGLRRVASKLEQSPEFSKYAKRLNDALDAGDTVKRDAVLFLLMQNPKMRAVVPDLIGEEE